MDTQNFSSLECYLSLFEIDWLGERVVVVVLEWWRDVLRCSSSERWFGRMRYMAGWWRLVVWLGVMQYPLAMYIYVILPTNSTRMRNKARLSPNSKVSARLAW
jgi:hypothetical protein